MAKVAVWLTLSPDIPLFSRKAAQLALLAEFLAPKNRVASRVEHDFIQFSGFFLRHRHPNSQNFFFSAHLRICSAGVQVTHKKSTSRSFPLSLLPVFFYSCSDTTVATSFSFSHIEFASTLSLPPRLYQHHRQPTPKTSPEKRFFFSPLPRALVFISLFAFSLNCENKIFSFPLVVKRSLKGIFRPWPCSGSSAPGRLRCATSESQGTFRDASLYYAE